MLLEIRHRLHFKFDDFVRESLMELRVEPISETGQSVQVFQLVVGPPPAVESYRDWNGNVVHHLGIRGYHERIEIEARSVVETALFSSDLDALDPPEPAGGEALDFLLASGPPRPGPGLVALEREIAPGPDASRGEQVACIGALLGDRLKYQKGVTDWKSSAEDAIEAGSGVCQDFAHVMIGLLRMRSIPCRYVSGYLHLANEGPAQSHAWVEVQGAAGWVGYDPTHTRVPDGRYVRVARGRHYDDVPPNRGVYRGQAEERLETTVETRELDLSEVASLRRDAPDLDVPVYKEHPERLAPVSAAAADQPPAAAAEQQQQQQQQ